MEPIGITRETAEKIKELRSKQHKYEGHDTHEVPTCPAGFKCNGKMFKRHHNDQRGYIDKFAGYCDNEAGKGTDGQAVRCELHGGAMDVATQHGRNDGHNIRADPHHYADSLSKEQQMFVEEAHSSIMNRIKKTKGDTDFLDEIMARRIVIGLHMVSKASDHVNNVSGLVQIIHGEHDTEEKQAALVSEIRKWDKDLFNMMKTLGILNDPESQTADELSMWRQFLASSDDDEDEVIDV